MTTDHVHEEIQLLANDVSTMLLETLADVPRWRDYYQAHDQTPHYEYLATQLKAMQFLRGGRRWLLEVAPASRAGAGPGSGLSRQHRGLHPSRPGAGGAVDDRDDHLLRPHAPLAGAGGADRRRPGSTVSNRCSPRSSAIVTPSVRTVRSTSVSTTSWPTNSALPSGYMPWPANRSPTKHERPSGDYLSGHRRGRLGNVETSYEMFGLTEGQSAGPLRALRRALPDVGGGPLPSQA